MLSPPKRIAGTIANFTGRKWLLPILLKWFEHSNERYFILTGEPGSGKSMVAAWLTGYGLLPDDPEEKEQLVRLRSYVKAGHFCIAASGNTAPKVCAENFANQLTSQVEGFAEALAASLTDRVQIIGEVHAGEIRQGGVATGVYIAHLDLAAFTEETSFDQTLRSPLKNLYASGYAKPIILLVDALDEAFTRTGHREEINLVRLLAKLDDLPEQVRLLVTTRPDPRVLKYYGGAKCFDLIKDAPESVDDVRLYTYERLPALTDGQKSMMAKRIADAAEGNFLYAHLVLTDLLTLLLTSGNLMALPLPAGLTGLYRDFLNRELGVDEDRWYEIFRPVLGLIMVGQDEGLTAAQLEWLTGQEVEPVLRVCKQYLDGELPIGPFRPFHRSFAQFLLEDEGNVDYHIDAVKMHMKIVEQYWTTYRGDWQRCDDYGLNNLATHLFECRDIERLQALINESWIRTRYERSNYSYDSFLADVELTWQATEKTDEEQINRNQRASYLAEEVRCALCFASISSLSSNIAPTLISTLVKQGVWLPLQGLNYARRVPESRTRYEALILLAPTLAEPLQTEALNEAFVAAKQIGDDEARAQALIRLLSFVTKALQAEVLINAMTVIKQLKDQKQVFKGQNHYEFGTWEIVNTGKRSKALVELGEVLKNLSPQLSASIVDEQLQAAYKIEDEAGYAQVLIELASHLESPPREALREVVAKINHDLDQGVILNEQSFRSPKATHESLMAKMRIGDDDERAKVLADFSYFMREKLKSETIEDALREVQKMEHDAEHSQFPIQNDFSYFAREKQEFETIEDSLIALEKVQRMEDSNSRLMALTKLIPRLPDSLLPEALAALEEARKTIHWPFPEYRLVKVRALIRLASSLSEPQRSEALAEALKEAKVEVAWWRLDERPDEKVLMTLVDLAWQLPEPLQIEVFDRIIAKAKSAVHGGRNYYSWNRLTQIRFLIGLLPHLPEMWQSEAVSIVLRTLIEDSSQGYVHSNNNSIMIGIAPYLPKQLLSDAEKFDPEGAWIYYLPATLLPEALLVARRQRNRNWLLGLTPRLSESMLIEALEVAKEIGGAPLQSELMAQFADAFARLSPVDLYPAWRDTLHSMASLNRQTFLRDFRTFPAIIAILGGQKAIEGILRAVRDVGRWWP